MRVRGLTLTIYKFVKENFVTPCIQCKSSCIAILDWSKQEFIIKEGKEISNFNSLAKHTA